MYYCMACGFEITLLCLSKMYNVDIVVIRPDFVWLSRAVAPITCPIDLVQDSSGNFLGTKTKNLVYIGLVPKISLPDPSVIRAKLHKIRQQFTLNRPMQSNNEAFRTFGGGLSPIVENSSHKLQANKQVVVRQDILGEDSSSNTSASTSLLRWNIKQFEEKNLSQSVEDNEGGKDLSTTYDPNELCEENGQRNEIESSCDQEEIQTSVTKEDSVQVSGTFDIGETDTSTKEDTQNMEEMSGTLNIGETNTSGKEDTQNMEEMSGTFDVAETNNSTLVNMQSKEEKDTSTSTSEEDKTETAEPSEENSGIVQDDYNENDYDENVEGEEENGFIDSSKQDQTDLNIARIENPDNSDDIIPTSNTQPESENQNIAVSNTDIPQTEATKTSASSEMVESTAIESTNMTNKDNSQDSNKPAMKQRLGKGGPAFTKRSIQVKMQDISTESDRSTTVEVKEEIKGGNKSVMRKLMCTKCPEMFFTIEGYQRHLFKDHKVRCFDKHPPQVIEKIVTKYNEETYETNYRILQSKDSENGGKGVTISEKKQKRVTLQKRQMKVMPWQKM